MLGGHGEDLELVDRPGALPNGRADAVAAGVAAADDGDDLVLGREGLAARHGVPGVQAVLLGEEFHGEVDALQLAAGHHEVARLAGPHGQADGVEASAQVAGGDVLADVHAGLELHALGRHLGQAAVEDVLVQLEVRDAVPQQPADAVVLLEDRHVVAGAGELLRRGQAGRARSR